MNGWREYAGRLSDKLMDAGNITFGALIVGQLISDRPFNWILAVAGAVVWVILYAGAYTVVQWGRGD